MCNLGITPDHVAFGTMINVFGNAKLFREVLQLIQEIRDSVVLSDTISSLTLLNIYVENQRTRKLDRAPMLFQKPRSSGAEIDQVLYQTMIVACEKASLVGHAKHLLHELKCLDNIPRDTVITILARVGLIGGGHLGLSSSYWSCRCETYPFLDLPDFERANAVNREMQDEGCVFPGVHFHVLTYGARWDFETVESLFEKLDSYPNINNKELLLLVASDYERANRLNNASPT
ncbi:Pentatricopeptide repeat [Dillenia turbinata]|uniref:Pentatricopeptide repeat n=1 Tax=Dillenia turbinata TaxID=194707 RepID=A0AAN8UNG6_9MAGN